MQYSALLRGFDICEMLLLLCLALNFLLAAEGESTGLDICRSPGYGTDLALAYLNLRFTPQASTTEDVPGSDWQHRVIRKALEAGWIKYHEEWTTAARIVHPLQLQANLTLPLESACKLLRHFVHDGDYRKRLNASLTLLLTDQGFLPLQDVSLTLEQVQADTPSPSGGTDGQEETSSTFNPYKIAFWAMMPVLVLLGAVTIYKSTRQGGGRTKESSHDKEARARSSESNARAQQPGTADLDLEEAQALEAASESATSSGSMSRAFSGMTKTTEHVHGQIAHLVRFPGAGTALSPTYQHGSLGARWDLGSGPLSASAPGSPTVSGSTQGLCAQQHGCMWPLHAALQDNGHAGSEETRTGGGRASSSSQTSDGTFEVSEASNRRLAADAARCGFGHGIMRETVGPAPVSSAAGALAWKASAITDCKVDFNLLALGEMIGSGSCKTVYRGMWSSNSVAIVQMRSGGMQAEANIMRELGLHPNLIRFYRWARDHNGHEYMIMELMSEGSLERKLRAGHRFPLSDKLRICEQVCSAMCELANAGLLHCDLAARNVLIASLDPVHVKVTDFGMARKWDGMEHSKRIHEFIPYRWAAPEMLRGQKCTEKTDVWAFGVTMWEIFSDGREPYASESVSSQFQGVIEFVQSGRRLPMPEDCPAAVYSIMEECWHEDASRRPKFDKLQTMLMDARDALNLADHGSNCLALPSRTKSGALFACGHASSLGHMDAFPANQNPHGSFGFVAEACRASMSSQETAAAEEGGGPGGNSVRDRMALMPQGYPHPHGVIPSVNKDEQ
mmetsp:Transcript_27732/g.65887  ORF Transcript_27732/g.65887 Transcript_27732/m.65887 type:complete len:790 (-) Transcript_27732:520-2889(-)